MPPASPTTPKTHSLGHNIFHFFLWVFAVIGFIGTLGISYILLHVFSYTASMPQITSQQTQGPSPGLDQTINRTLLHAALKHYHDRSNGMYPTTLENLVPYDLSSIPTDIDGIPYKYRATENGRGYELCNITDSKEQNHCLGTDSAGNSTGM